MARVALKLVAAAAVAALLGAGCGKREAPTALYVLEELEAASAVKDPAGKVDRLAIFIGNHPDHPYRFLAYERSFETLSTEMKNGSKAAEFLASSLAKETDRAARGELLLVQFSNLMENDKTAAIAFADSMLRAELSPRLFLYMGYYLMDPKADPARALKCFLKAADLSEPPYAKAHALAMAGSVLMEQDKYEEAKRYLAMAAGDPEADRSMGGMLWKEGKRDEALDLFIRSVARMPGAREIIRLDSLYAMVHPDAEDLDRRIMSLRIGDEGPMPEGVFSDLQGREFDLSKFKGTKIVLYALSPT
jgi:tetratricopeptide (TPR) repeat protein